jgi:hypothetical protein
VLSLSLFDVGG